jgi:hypothetical protein
LEEVEVAVVDDVLLAARVGGSGLVGGLILHRTCDLLRRRA